LLVLALGLLVLGAVAAGLKGDASIASAPAIASPADRPADAPPIWPFLFITIACGACSGFHCLVSSGTTSKQIAREPDAQYVAYGSMLLEAALAVVVVLACTAGVGMMRFERQATRALAQVEYRVMTDSQGQPLQGKAAWESRYNPHGDRAWSRFELKEPVGAFVEGGANFLSAIGIPVRLGVALIAVLVACFAATTMDTATRLQRYVIQELAAAAQLRPLTNPYAATAFAVLLSGVMAVVPAAPDMGPGSGGKLLWPLFGATNQLLAGLAFLVTAFYLRRRNRPIAFLLVPMVLMILMPAWAMAYQMFHPENGWWARGRYVLFAGSGIILLVQIWMVWEAIWLWPRVRGVPETPLPPLPSPAKS
jgi:carbon starvation protein